MAGNFSRGTRTVLLLPFRHVPLSCIRCVAAGNGRTATDHLSAGAAHHHVLARRIRRELDDAALRGVEVARGFHPSSGAKRVALENVVIRFGHQGPLSVYKATLLDMFAYWVNPANL